MTLSARGIAFSRNGRRILHDVSLDVCAGELVAVLGPNGAGKSTLLKLMAGELTADAGELRLNDTPLGARSRREQARLRAVLPQHTDVAFPFTCEEIVLMGRAPHQQSFETAHDRAIAAEIMARLGVLQFARRSIFSLSGGEQQRVHLARVLAQIWDAAPQGGARYLLIDEPTASLDPAFQLLVLDTARDLARRGIGVMAVLHDFNLAALHADRLAVMKDGRIACLGTPEQVIRADMMRDVYGIDAMIGRIGATGQIYVVPLPQARGKVEAARSPGGALRAGPAPAADSAIRAAP
ncbi:MAG: heme ABC transporter ATP-binding protein [Alphaproteobacteria bacterium]